MSETIEKPSSSQQSSAEEKSYELKPIPCKPFFITTPIYYVNGAPHVGHLYTSLLADSMKRWCDLRKIPNFFLSGTDEHGQKVGQTADEKHISPKAWCDQMVAEFSALYKQFDIMPDRFIRTTDDDHVRAVQHVWRKLKEAGHIYKGKYEGWYCKSDEAFATALNVHDVVVDPKTGRTEKRTIDSDRPVEWLSEENYKFRLSAFRAPLVKWIEEHPSFIVPAFRRDEIIAMLKNDIAEQDKHPENIEDFDLSVSRKTVKWGIPVPDDPDHTIYVWIDALTNYLTACGYPDNFSYAKDSESLDAPSKSAGPSSATPTSSQSSEGDSSSSAPLPIPSKQAVATWPANIHLVGKDIIKFHAIYWPAFLLGLGLEPYYKLVVHGWWTKNKMKISKSAGNAFDIDDTLKQIGGTYPCDAFRYILMKESNISIDCDFSDHTMTSLVNSDLADSLGNLVLRCISKTLNPSLIVPAPVELGEIEQNLITLMNNAAAKVDTAMQEVDTQAAVLAILEVLTATNGYAQRTEPWKLKPVATDSDEVKATKKPRLDTILCVMSEALRVASTLLLTFIPSAAANVLDRLNVPKEQRYVEFCKFGAIQFNRPINFSDAKLFEKIGMVDQKKAIAEATAKKQALKALQIQKSKEKNAEKAEKERKKKEEKLKAQAEKEAAEAKAASEEKKE
ncbi:putative methionyl-tRNA synthetase [Monocercomonoides exilis]|uniref:putative methionyl-tRNA synthetase n=1 Tax=Monocercomonoides exilis TaxID=2049356 RepID=UPI00355AB35E|nr:putative methionyl-tRNA synthetase [Monocercomonoides exilis]|eukprot:MONOS_10920.1-p1 / transcript=MONOS_10920.1 / gene=MONOS_10920 / organism=Monocercomonoides_exilis_PA203 / gene_product=methionyl-tRNA synthetase / transcript_product=methionyl-tRNA synthetase / location=Mono_scaffold00518:24056-26257(+) / protein_length=676 / sequence_SO=supercontig / SO=protein_coding / is_pseudo=false